MFQDPFVEVFKGLCVYPVRRYLINLPTIQLYDLPEEEPMRSSSKVRVTTQAPSAKYLHGCVCAVVVIVLR